MPSPISASLSPSRTSDAHMVWEAYLCSEILGSGSTKLFPSTTAPTAPKSCEAPSPNWGPSSPRGSVAGTSASEIGGTKLVLKTRTFSSAVVRVWVVGVCWCVGVLVWGVWVCMQGVGMSVRRVWVYIQGVSMYTRCWYVCGVRVRRHVLVCCCACVGCWYVGCGYVCRGRVCM